MASQIVFYSWQSDRPNSTNRGLIQTALEKAAREIRKDESLQVEPVIERDTAGVAGSPDIAATIFGKIDTADVFVADVTLVTVPDVSGRQAPNPNVLIELGYAVKALGWNRVVMVMNSHFGGPELLPFDLRTRRVIPYGASTESEEGRRTARDHLQRSIEGSLRDIIERHGPPRSGEAIRPARPADLAIEAISKQSVDRDAHVRRYVDSFVTALDAVAPDLASQQWRDDELVQGLEQSVEEVATFIRTARTAADTKDRESALSLHRAVELIAQRQYLPNRFNGTFYESQFDVWRFLTNEVFVSLVATFVAADQLETAVEIIHAPVVIPNKAGNSGVLSLHDLCQPIRTLIERNRLKKLHRVSVQADILGERRKNYETELSMQQYRDGDLFLFCASDLVLEQAPQYPVWRPYSVLFEFGAPRFLLNAVAKSRAERLALVLGLTVPTLKARLKERIRNTTVIYGDSFWFDISPPLDGFDIDLIASRG